MAAALFVSLQSSASTKVNPGGFSDTETHIDSAKANKLDVKYLGNSADALEFDVHYNNVKGSTFYFIVKDENGEILFEKEYNNKQFHKKVQLAKVDDLNKISFSISSEKDNIEFTKDIVIKTRFVEDVLVKIN